MSFEEFRKLPYHTRTKIRIPGSRTVIDKSACMNKKGKLDHKKIDSYLKQVYDEENFAER